MTAVNEMKAMQPTIPEAGGNLTGSASGTVLSLDVTAFRGKFVTIQVDGADTYFSAGTGTAATDVTAPATSSTNIGLKVRDGSDKDVWIPEGTPGPSNKYYIRAITGGTSATVTVVPTSR